MGLAGTRIILEINHSVGVVGVTLTYRWWTSDNDPWQANAAGWLGANSGAWSPSYFFSKETHLWGNDSEGNKLILKLKNVGGDSQPFKKDSKGTGEHFGVGGKIPGVPTPEGLDQRGQNLLRGLGIGAPIEWSVIAIN